MLAFSIYYWPVGWLFGAAAWVVDMKLGTAWRLAPERPGCFVETGGR
jgi:hypothetical protein